MSFLQAVGKNIENNKPMSDRDFARKFLVKTQINFFEKEYFQQLCENTILHLFWFVRSILLEIAEHFLPLEQTFVLLANLLA
jgi:hypothetical protein